MAVVLVSSEIEAEVIGGCNELDRMVRLQLVDVNRRWRRGM